MSSDPKTLSEKAYLLLRDDIVFGHLPSDKKLKVSELRQRYDIGAAPLREALSRLAAEKLVLLEGQRGFYVAPLSAADAADVGRVRLLLELEALRMSLDRGDDAWEAELSAAFHRLRLVEERDDWSEDGLREKELWNAHFHDALLAACNSAWLLDLRRQVYFHHERYRHISRRRRTGDRDTPAEHRAIFDAAIARDVDTVCRLVTRHIGETTENVLRVLGEES